jgi:diguanylate cyclase (GGDEF)-like protein
VERRFRSRYGRAAVLRAALLVFLLAGALTAAVVITLDRNARHSNNQEAATDLAGVARVSASTFGTMHANLKTRAGELASSPTLQRALLRDNRAALSRFATSQHARIVLHRRAVGTLPPGPRMTATANITSAGRVLARMTIAVPLDRSLLAALQTSTPMPQHSALVLVRNGRVIAGGPVGASAVASHGNVQFGAVGFVAREAELPVGGASVLAVEPVAAVNARVEAYRSRLLFAAALTLALAAGLAVRLGRPVARVLGDLARLRHHAQTDALTNLANRRALDERLDDEVDHARRLGTSIGFVIADIDNFKSINDRFGHQTGDAVLREVARVFAEAVRELDLPGRYGGEEIAVVLPGTQLAGARRLADRIRKAVEELYVTAPDGTRVDVTASFGAACFPTHGSVEALVAAADGALYEAKKTGKNRVVTATAKKKSRAKTADAPVEAAVEAS